MRTTCRLTARLGLALFLILSGLHVAVRAQSDAEKAYEAAEDLLDDNRSHEAVAVLADAARKFPQDRKIGGWLFALLRDRHWPVSAVLPVKLPGAVKVVDFSADSSRVIAGCDDGTVRIVNPETGEFIGPGIRHDAGVIAVAILPGNELALSVSKTGVARYWQIRDGKTEREWSDPKKTFATFALSKDLQRVAVGYVSGEVVIFNHASGASEGEAIKPGQAVTALAFSPDAQALAVATQDGACRVWNLTTGKPRDFTVRHEGRLMSVDFDRKGTLLLTASESGIAKVTDATTGAPVVPEMNCGAAIYEARFGSSGFRIMTVLADHTVRLWDTLTGKEVDGVIRTDKGIPQADWGPAGLRIVTASDGVEAHLWRATDGEQLDEGMLHESPVSVAAFGPNSRFIATGCTDGTLRLWRQDVGAANRGLPTVRRHRAAARTAFFSGDGKGIVTASNDGTAVRWDPKTAKPLGHYLDLNAPVACAVYSRNRAYVATVSDDGKVCLFSGEKGDRVGEPRDLGAPGTWVDFHPDEKRFLTTSGSKAMLWSVDKLAGPQASVEHPEHGKLNMARFSPDGSLFVTAGEDGTARIWKTQSQESVATLTKHQAPVVCARFSFDGKRLVTGATDGSIFAWDTTTWQSTGAPMILPGELTSALIGPNDQFVVATSSESGGVIFIEIATGREFADDIDMPSQVLCVDLHASGDLLAIACADGSVKTYDSPFVSEDTPAWFPDFAEKVVGLRMAAPGRFEPVYASYDEIKRFPPAGVNGNDDFPSLARWMVTAGSDRTGMPRNFATISANVQELVLQRSVEALYDAMEAAPADPLILAALSLFVPFQRQGEYLAEYALERSQGNPVAQSYCAATFAKYGRMDEAEQVMKAALTAAPDNFRVLRRAAKLDARQGRKAEALVKFEQAVKLEPDDFETHRSFGWVLYNLGETARCLEEFAKASDLRGGTEEDVEIGICLASDAAGKEADALSRYRALAKHDPHVSETTFGTTLDGWTEKEVATLKKIRQLSAAESKP